MTVKRNTIVVWKWPAGGGDAHDVVLKKGPKGVKRFASEVFLADEIYRKRLKVPGTLLDHLHASPGHDEADDHRQVAVALDPLRSGWDHRGPPGARRAHVRDAPACDRSSRRSCRLQ